jgi:hypothetical protein
MQKPLLVFLAVATVGLSCLCVAQWRQLRHEADRRRATELVLRTEAQAREESSARATQAESRADRLEREIAEFSAVTSGLRSNNAAQQTHLSTLHDKLQRNSTNAAGGSALSGKEMGDMLSKMMKDPEMRKMVRGQQRAAVDMMYAGLFKQMNLAPEEKTELTELLLDAQMRQVENAQGLLGGAGTEGVDPAQQRDLFEQQRRESDARIKELLGEERFAEYTDYRKNIGERMQLDRLQTQLASSNLPLKEDQTAQLWQFMQEEKKRVPPIVPSDAEMSPADLKNLMSSDNLEKQTQWLDDYNKRVLDRAAAVLTPEQLQKYRELQEEQTAMQKLGLKMARGMFGQQGGGSPAPAK